MSDENQSVTACVIQASCITASREGEAPSLSENGHVIPTTPISLAWHIVFAKLGLYDKLVEKELAEIIAKLTQRT